MYIYVPYLVRQHKRPAIHYYTYILRDVAHLSRYEMIPSGPNNCFQRNDIVPFQQLITYIMILLYSNYVVIIFVMQMMTTYNVNIYIYIYNWNLMRALFRFCWILVNLMKLIYYLISNPLIIQKYDNINR